MSVQVLSVRAVLRMGLLGGVLAAAALSASAEGEQVVARIFEHAGRLLQEGRPELALDEYRRLVDTYPNSDLAGDALLAIGSQSYPVDSLDGLGRAQGSQLEEAFRAFDRVRREHPQGNAAPAAILRMALVRLEPRSAAYSVDEARALFGSVSEIYPESQWVDEARLGMAYCSRLADAPARVITDLQPFSEELSASPLAARAALWRADAFQTLGQRSRALDLYQRLRETRPRSPEGAAAQGRALLLMRRALAARGAGRLVEDSGFTSARIADLRQAPQVAISAQGWFYLVDRDHGRLLRLDARGQLLDEKAVTAPAAVTLDPYGQAAVLEGTAVRAGRQRSDLAVPEGKRMAPLAPAAAPLPRRNGSWWILDGRGRAVLEFDRALAFKRVVWSDDSLSVTRARLGPDDTAWLLDTGGGSLVRLSASGEARSIRLDEAPASLRRPADLAVDASGAVWVLDSQRAGLAVFSPSGQYEGFVSIGAGEGSTLESLDIETGGALVSYDTRQRRLRRFVDALPSASATQAGAPGGGAPLAVQGAAEVRP